MRQRAKEMEEEKKYQEVRNELLRRDIEEMSKRMEEIEQEIEIQKNLLASKNKEKIYYDETRELLKEFKEYGWGKKSGETFFSPDTQKRRKKKTKKEEKVKPKQQQKRQDIFIPDDNPITMQALLESKSESLKSQKEPSVDEVIWISTLKLFHKLTAGNQFLTKEELQKRYNTVLDFKKRDEYLRGLGDRYEVSIENMEKIYLEAIKWNQKKFKSIDDVLEVPLKVKKVLKSCLPKKSKFKPKNR